jgi:hypothetical protein
LLEAGESLTIQKEVPNMMIRIASGLTFAALLGLLSACSGVEPAAGKADQATQGQPEGYG